MEATKQEGKQLVYGLVKTVVLLYTIIGVTLYILSINQH